jgi:hypothetical protein
MLHSKVIEYRTHAIITHSWILTIHKDRIFWKKNLLENKEMVFKNGVKHIQAAGYNGVHKVFITSQNYILKNWYSMKRSSWKEMFEKIFKIICSKVLQQSLRLALRGYTAFLQQASFSAMHTT